MFNLLFTSFLAFATAQSTVKDCGQGSSTFVLNSLSVDPNTPVRNQNYTLNLDYTVPDGLTVISGTATYTLTYNFIPLSPTTEDICKDTTCPITPGGHSQSSTTLFPDVSGTLVAKSQWYDDAKTLLLCYQITMKV